MKDNLPATLDDALAQDMKAYARARLASLRVEGHDPFDNETMHRAVRKMLYAIAEASERNAAFIADAARGGMEDAHEALSDLISERHDRGEPLGRSLMVYIDQQSWGPAVARAPEGRTRNYLADHTRDLRVTTRRGR